VKSVGLYTLLTISYKQQRYNTHC